MKNLINRSENDALLRMPQLCNMLGVKKSTIYNYLDPKSAYYKPDFPKRLKLGSNAVWRLNEVQLYIEKLTQSEGE